MKSAYQSAKQFKKNSSPDIVRRLEDLEARGALFSKSTLVKPNVIVGGGWPSRMAGSRRYNCSECNCYIGLMADSGIAAHDTFPDVPVMCFDCAEKLIRASDDESLAQRRPAGRRRRQNLNAQPFNTEQP